MDLLDRTTRALTRALGGVDRLGVAFSGGVDSSVLLALSVRVLGVEHVLALLGVSPSLAARERTAAHDVALQIGARLVEIPTFEGDDPAYRANGVDRCFHCKSELFDRIDNEVVREHGLTAIAYGENADDAVRIDRPGARAATEHRVLRPLADLGLTKSDVRDAGPRPRPGLRGQAGRALSGVPDPALLGGDAREAAPDRPGRGGIGGPRAQRLPGPPSRRSRPGRTRGRRSCCRAADP